MGRFLAKAPLFLVVELKCVRVCVSMYMYVCTGAHVYVQVCTCVPPWVPMCMNVYVCLYVCVCERESPGPGRFPL